MIPGHDDLSIGKNSMNPTISRPPRARRRRASLIVLTLAVCVQACSSLPPPRLYAMTPVTLGAGAAAPGPAAARVVAVRLPDYLDHDQIVRRTGANEIRLDDDNHWAERPSLALARILTLDLSGLPRAPGARPVTIELDLSRFDVDQSGQAILSGHWTAATVDGPVAEGILDLRATPGGPGAAADVAALNACVSDAARQIARGLGLNG